MMAAGVASGVGATLFGIQALHQKQDSDSQCPSYFGQTRCQPGGADDNSKANVSAWISDGFIALAVAGLGIGSYFFFTGGQEHAATPTTGKGGNWNWVVGATPKSASGSLTHSF